MNTQPSAQPNQSLIDGIRTLQALATTPGPIGCRPLARQLGFDVTRTNRLLKTLAHLGIAQQDANRKYMAGPGMHILAAQSLFASGLLNRAVPILERLRKFGHTVAMGVRWNDAVSYLFHAPPGVDATRAIGRIGILPASTSGIGMALLAELDDEAVAAIYSRGEPIPGHTAGIKSLLGAVAQVRQLGYARLLVNAEENRHTVAVVVGHPVYAAIAISGWLPAGNTEELVLALREAAAAIETGQMPEID